MVEMGEVLPNRSTPFKELPSALAKVQNEVKNPKFNQENPHFKMKYADLAEVFNTIRPVLTKHGLSVWQDVYTEEDKVVIVTEILHESGEYLRSSPLKIPASRGGKGIDAQSIGAAISYGKRYQVSAMIGIAAESDDDGESLMDRKPTQAPYAPPKKVEFTKAQLAAKWQIGTGSRQGFEEYYEKEIAQNHTHEYISAALDKAIQKKKTQPNDTLGSVAQ